MAQAASHDSVVVHDERRGSSWQRHLGDQRGSTAGSRLDRELAADQAQPLAHAVEPHPLARGVGIEAAAVVLDQRGDDTTTAVRTMLTLRASACLTMLVSASCTIR